MLNEKLSEYQAVVIQVNQLEKEIKDFFNLLAIRDNPRFERGADYGQRCVEIIIPFDEINLSLLTIEKVNKIKKIISQHRELRKIQSVLENEVNKFNAINNNIKNSLGIL